MDRKTISAWIETAIAILIIGIAVYGPLALGGVRVSEFVFVQWAAVVLVALWILRLWIARPRFLMPPTCWAILPFVGYAIWRYCVADVEYAARQEFIQVLVLAIVFLAFVNNAYGQDPIRWLSFSLVTLATVLSMYGVYQWLSGSNHVWGFTLPGYEGRGSGSYISPNHLAGLLEMVLPIAIAMLVAGRVAILTRVFLAYATLVIVAGIGGTASRAAWMTTAVTTCAIGLMLLRTRRQWWAALAIVTFVIAAGFWLYPRVINPRMQSPSGHLTVSDDIRYRIWKSSTAMWRDHALFGVGPNHFEIRYGAYRLPQWEMGARPGYVHNDYLNTLVDWGTVGLALVLLPIGVGVFGVVRSWTFVRRTGGEFRQKGGNRLALMLGPAMGLLAILIHSFFDFNMHIPANAMVAILLLAIVTAHWRFATERYWINAGWTGVIIGTLVLGAAGAYLAREALVRTREAVALRKADRAAPGSKANVNALLEAFAADPRDYETAYYLGETFRLRSEGGGDGSEEAAREAISWFNRTTALDAWHVYCYVRCGMCYDWLEDYDDAERCFKKAVELDPNYYYTRAMMGWHEFQCERYKEALRWFEASLTLNANTNNSVAYTYWDLAEKRLRESGKNSGK